VEHRNPFLSAGGLDWAREQLKEAGYDQTTAAHLTRKVLETLAPYIVADPEQVAEAMPVVAQLIQGKPLGEDLWTEEKKRTATHVWRPVQVRGVHVGDTVRIKHDAFQGREAVLNGRTGKVTALRGGIIVMYDDVVDKSKSLGARHTAGELEVQIAIPRRVTK
jgi:hypothetical protein